MSHRKRAGSSPLITQISSNRAGGFNNGTEETNRNSFLHSFIIISMKRKRIFYFCASKKEFSQSSNSLNTSYLAH